MTVYKFQNAAASAPALTLIINEERKEAGLYTAYAAPFYLSKNAKKATKRFIVNKFYELKNAGYTVFNNTGY